MYDKSGGQIFYIMFPLYCSGNLLAFLLNAIVAMCDLEIVTFLEIVTNMFVVCLIKFSIEPDKVCKMSYVFLTDEAKTLRYF